MSDTDPRYSHLIGQPVNDGSHGVVKSIEVLSDQRVEATTTDGTVVNVTPFAKKD